MRPASRAAPDAATLLGIGRITLFGTWLVIVLTTPAARYAELPQQIFSAPGVLRLLPAGPLHALVSSAALLTALQAVLVIGLVWLVLGLRPFLPVALPVAGLLLLFDGIDKGFNGFINHAQIALVLGAFVLCLFPAADAVSVAGRRPGLERRAGLHAGGLLAVAVLLLAAYSFIGTHRVIRSGPELFTGDAILTYLAVQSLHYSGYGFEHGLLGLRFPLLAAGFKLGFLVTTCFEILSPLCLVSTWFRRVWLVVIVPFHVSTLLTMNIFFWENILLIFAFVAPIGYVLAARDDGAGGRTVSGVQVFAPERGAAVADAPGVGGTVAREG